MPRGREQTALRFESAFSWKGQRTAGHNVGKPNTPVFETSVSLLGCQVAKEQEDLLHSRKNSSEFGRTTRLVLQQGSKAASAWPTPDLEVHVSFPSRPKGLAA